MFKCDLHTHTTRSDGHVTPIESIDRAADFGIKVLAITDHDTILPLYYETENGMVNLESYAAEKGIELIRGIEISCDTENEDVHIIGLFCQWNAPAFAELEKSVQESRTNGYKEMVRRIIADGYEISWEEMLEDAGLCDTPERVCRKHIFEYFVGKGYADTWQEGKKWIQSVPKYNVKREKPDPIKVIQMLRETGGISILAHPFLIGETVVYNGKCMSRYEYIDMLKEAGLNGIEACYTYDKTSYKGVFSKEEIEKMIRDRYENKGLFISGGSDFHGDFKTGMKNPRELGECGIVLDCYYENIKR